MTDKDRLQQLLQSTLQNCEAHEGLPDNSGATCTIVALQRLSGGASMETWSFDWQCKDQRQALIARLKPMASNTVATDSSPVEMGQIPLQLEAQLLAVLSESDVKAPQHICDLPASDGIAEGYVMSREQGEALPAKILAQEQYAAARDNLAFECGQQLAMIHQIPVAKLPEGLSTLSTSQRLDNFQQLSDRFGNLSPVHQLAINWLREHQPEQHASCLLHGDFRNGNLLVNLDGLSSILDWELAHIGHPEEDLGYLCANVWRFGRADKPVGGFGDYQQLLDGYQSISGWSPERRTLKYWELFAALSWGMVCLVMEDVYHRGIDPSLERLAIGRRVSESEVDIMLLLDELQAYQSVNVGIDNIETSKRVDEDTKVDNTEFGSATSLLNGVTNYLKDELIPKLDPYTAYTTRVAINSLKIAARDFQSGDKIAELDERIAAHLQLPVSARPTPAICLAMRETADFTDTELVSMLKQRCLLALQVNNPKYWGYQEALAKWQ